jgi:phenylalanyl-tRNA synthetase beta chain
MAPWWKCSDLQRLQGQDVAYAIRYRSSERTLTDQKVTDAHTRIVEELGGRLGESLRASNP